MDSQTATSTASGGNATVGGGFNNTASGVTATVVEDSTTSRTPTSPRLTELPNLAIAYQATVGGEGNIASGIGGGDQNVASGEMGPSEEGDSTAQRLMGPSGRRVNQAGGHNSFAAGSQAKIRDASQSGDPDGDEGTFAWADSTGADFNSTGPNQFLIRAAGGVGINTNSPTPGGLTVAQALSHSERPSAR